MKKQTWLIVVAFVVGWILAPLTDPPVISDPGEVMVMSTEATSHSTTDSQLASR